MIRPMLTTPNPVLRKKSELVSKIGKETKGIIKDLIDTADSSKETGGVASVGLAAVQIGQPIRVLVIKEGKKFTAFINPEIIEYSKKTLSDTLKDGEDQFLEGCLSIPGIYGFVNRPISVKIKWLDEAGKRHSANLKDKRAVYFQHEYDHLDGILFVDRILEQKGKMYKVTIDSEGQETLVEFRPEKT